MKEMSIFDEQYRVVAVETGRLLVRGILSGDVLTIINTEPETPLTQEDYPLGKLIALNRPVNFASELGWSISAVLQVLRRIPLRHRDVPELCSEPSNFEHRAILRKAHHLCR